METVFTAILAIIAIVVICFYLYKLVWRGDD